MSFVELEYAALRILTALEDMNSDRTAMAAARALADALADAAEADSTAKVAA